MKSKILLGIFSFFSVLILSTDKTFAADNQFITIVNPVRISAYNPDVVASLKSQYKQINSRKLPATWLFTPEVLENKSAVAYVKSFSSNQEIGLFLEVTPASSSISGIEYHKSGSWHFAQSVFLSGYSQSDRKKFIDYAMKKYFSIFNHYPTSVGSWWTDSYSLNYLTEKYHVNANLGCADQFSTDGYQIWGTYWSTPYYPSKNHTGIPAQSLDNKLNLVQFEWAPRDPYQGYFDSKYSTQDYFTTPQKDIDYFQSLVNLYANAGPNKFGQVTIGLEGDFLPSTYSGIYSDQLDITLSQSKMYGYKFSTMSEFAQWYQSKFPQLSPVQTISLGGATWYNTPKYRIGYITNSNQQIDIIDFRVYSDETQEPYYISPNSQNYLEINIPNLVDVIGDPDSKWSLPKFSEIDFQPDYLTISASDSIQIPKILSSYPGVKISTEKNKIRISLINSPIGSGKGYVYPGLSLEAKHFFAQKKFPFELLKGNGWEFFKKVNYYVSPDEQYALFRLSTLPFGKVLTPDYECLQCTWSTAIQPAAYANERGYISLLSKHPVVKNSQVFGSDRQTSKNAFTSSGAKYIYLVKYSGLRETIPFSPGDLGVRLIYANANAEIWQAN